MEPYTPDLLWMVIIGFILAFFLSFAIGANDVANAFGTSVGSGVLTFKQACILAAIFETLGAVLIGYKVSDTIRKGIIDVAVYEGAEDVLVLGMLAALLGSTIWILLATWLRVPVSTTHSTVGSIIGFSLVAHGGEGLKVSELIQIVISWFVSPVMSGVMGIVFYTLIKFLILNAKHPFKAGLISLPIIYAITIFINILAITLGGSKLLGMSDLKLWMCFVISIGVAVLVALIVQFVLVPWQKKRVQSIVAALNNGGIEPPSISKDVEAHIVISTKENFVVETKDVVVSNKDISATGSTVSLDSTIKNEGSQLAERLFHYLQTLSAIFTSFAHGGNDVSNSIGPLITIWTVYIEGSVNQKSESPIYLLFYGAVGMVFGLVLLGSRVNDTVGKRITKIVPTNGFTVEIAAATTVLIASKIGVPVSTTHCVVGAVVFVGCVYGEKNNGSRVNWKLFASIFSAWIITVPVSCGISALIMYFFKLGFGF